MSGISPPPAAQPQQTVAVIGLGSIGGVVAGCLAAAGRHRVLACVRQPLQKLVLDAPAGTVELPLAAFTDPAHIKEPADWVLVCTKTHQTPSAAPWLARLCVPGTRVAVLQNGIGHVERVAPLARGAAVQPIIVYYNGERLAPDRVRLRQGSDQDMAAADDADGRAFAQLFAGTPLRVHLSPEFSTLIWRKLLINAVANPITTLTLQRQAVLRRPDIQELCLAVLAEAVAVGRAEGVRFEDDEAARAMATLFTFSGELGTSMYFDRLAGRTLEVEALTGAIVAAGERHGIATPLNRTLLALLRAVNDAATAKSE
ncbi:MAG TPA: 2-dehydropantoate 2-reductase [Xanthobacteraceae bacterium]|nr:2-dehydropantoate 2-reductase [Xanthobacteraceae bacterium]